MTRFLLLSDSCGFVDMGHPLWREDGSVFYNVQYTIYFTVSDHWNHSHSRILLYPPARTTHRKQPLYCCVRVCWGSHVIATQPVHWRVDSCLTWKTLLLLRGACVNVFTEPLPSNALRKYVTVCHGVAHSQSQTRESPPCQLTLQNVEWQD
jgi:hypothetical protein